MHPPTTSSPSTAPGRFAHWLRSGWRTLVGRQELVACALLLAFSVLIGLRADSFLAGSNLNSIARAFSWIAIAAFGEGLVIIIGGIDLSVGAVMALSGLICALALREGVPVPLAILLGLLTGSAVGLVNGLLIGRVGLPPFIVTLGTLSIARGLTLSLTDGEPVRNLPASFRDLGQAELVLGDLRLSLPVVCMLVLWVMMSLVLSRTVLGRYVYTLGSNSRALAVAGIDTARLKVLVYTLCGLLTALAGLIMTARVGMAAPTAADGYELDIIAAAVIGGISLFGGEGSMTGVLIGAALMQVVRNGLVLVGVPPQWHAVAIGLMILLVLLLDYWRRRRVTI
jgi:ribose transport system permease protein